MRPGRVQTRNAARLRGAGTPSFAGRRPKMRGLASVLRLGRRSDHNCKEEILLYFAQQWAAKSDPGNLKKLSKHECWYWFAKGSVNFLTNFLKLRRN
jgi:hypothetical protein